MKQKKQTDFVGCRISKEKKQKAEAILNNEQKSISDFVREAVEQLLKERGELL